MPRMTRMTIVIKGSDQWVGTTTILILAEAALETVPADIANHPAVTGHARRLGLKTSRTLLDRSYHHAAMKGLSENWKRDEWFQGTGWPRDRKRLFP